jgi:hypothetical protein
MVHPSGRVHYKCHTWLTFYIRQYHSLHGLVYERKRPHWRAIRPGYLDWYVYFYVVVRCRRNRWLFEFCAKNSTEIYRHTWLYFTQVKYALISIIQNIFSYWWLPFIFSLGTALTYFTINKSYFFTMSKLLIF